MRIVMFQSMALGAAILSCSSAFAVTLEGARWPRPINMAHRWLPTS